MFSCLGQSPLYSLQWQGLAGGGGGLEHGGLLKHESDMLATPGACAHSGRIPSQCLQRQGLLYGERGHNGCPFCMCHSTMVPCFHGSLCFLQKHSQLHRSSLQSPQTVSMQPTAVLSLNLLSKFHAGKGNGNPLQYSCLGNPMGRGAWRAIVHGHNLVTKQQ